MHWRTKRALKRGLAFTAVALGVVLLCALAIRSALTHADPGDSITIERIALTTDADGAPAITGALHNNTLETFDYVQVYIQLLDANDDSVGHLAPSTTKLAPGATWTFQLLIDGDVARFRVTSLACLADGSAENRCALGRYLQSG